MKKIIKISTLFLAAVLLFASCASSDDDEDSFTVESNWEYNDFEEDDENPEVEYYFDGFDEDDDNTGEYEEESEYDPGYTDNDDDDDFDEAEEANYITDQIAMNLSINGVPLLVEWEDNDAVRELNGMVKSETLAVKMSRYGGFEQVGSLGVHLSREDEEMNAQPGDIVLYSGNRIVVFYGENTWSYTPLGHIIGMYENELIQLLGGSSTDLVISAG